MPKLIQISDCHIDDQPMVMGVDSQHNLQLVAQRIKEIESDGVLISGDLTHQGTLNSYQTLKEILRPIKQPIFVIGGNHDQADNLEKIFKKSLFKSFKLANWEIINIDSVQAKKTHGLVTQSALLELDQACLNSDAAHIMIVLHHPIVPMNSSWDDALSLTNPQDLFQVLDKHSKIRLITFGHAHEAAEFSHLGITILSCPSTALQFNQAPLKGALKRKNRIGFNELELNENGTINFKTQWI
ncbi:3',5'-cyclic-nucleotide phosphodiesterase [Candidatus Thioglobus autotrophicus]|uniref:3',5'-cyclic-nucleotide phosphodiesterase n=1 Tax=Candidatus Thioglobus autotrophicus TaxID=1705394 RepID=A0A0M4NXD9_9GAMM|nr:metallophosphoesterase [Candidatus Thioglobus autotrophicus]ALE52968.1 3',5'-cyclic-nucleotide phosphodiesterase [Candidatus Thioglobus autotrophicus]WPE17037.1 metallophosphoesterase [Candidatus Thioglobus autotrophicus]